MKLQGGFLLSEEAAFLIKKLPKCQFLLYGTSVEKLKMSLKTT
jgi:hypothetical protein